MILLLGKNGLLGAEFNRLLKKDGISFFAPGREELDLLDFEKVQQYIADTKPSKSLLCAAYTDVEKAEHHDRDLCRQMNVEVVRNLLKSKVPLIHFSSDYVFGHYDPGTEISEDSERSPLNYYGQTKYEAEMILEASPVPFWNIRTSWLFGEYGENFVTTLLKASQTKKTLKVINDQIGRPTAARDLAAFVFVNFIIKDRHTGHYHLQNSGEPVSWAGFAKYFLDIVKWPGEIQGVSSDEWGASAERPRNSVLKNTKLHEQMPGWDGAVRGFVCVKFI